MLVPLTATAQFLTKPKTIEHNPPPLSFFEDCVFVCIDIQEGGGEPVTSIPKTWEAMGYTVETCNAASLHYGQTVKPNARRVADACRALGLPMVFVHWGARFKDGMDMDPRLRKGWAEGTNPEEATPHIDKPGSRPDKGLGIREGEYVLAKTAQDAFTSCNVGFVLENLEAKHLVFVGGHTNPGGCLGQTAKSARAKGYTILCIEDATYDAGEITRIPGIAAVPFDYVLDTATFVALAEKAAAGRIAADPIASP